MSEEEAPAEGEGHGGDGHKKAKPKVAILAVIGVVVLALVGGGGYFVASKMGGKKKETASKEGEGKEGKDGKDEKEPSKEEKEPAKEEHGGGGGEGGHGGKEGEHPGGSTFVSLDPIVVNLSGDEGKRFMKVTMQMEMASTKAVGEVQNKMPQVKDSVITLISSKSAEDLLTPDGKFKLKEQLITRVNAVLTGGTVKNVFFVEFIIQ